MPCHSDRPSTTFRSEVFHAAQQLRYEERQENLLARAEKKARPAGGSDSPKAKRISLSSIQDTLLPIELLIVAIKAYTVVDSVKALVPRLTPNSTIVLLHNGTGVYERLVEDVPVFRNPEQRPHFLVAFNDRGAWNKDYFHTVHAGIGSITFGIVADPPDRNFEASVADEDVPTQTHDRALSLDSNIMSSQERDDDSP